MPLFTVSEVALLNEVLIQMHCAEGVASRSFRVALREFFFIWQEVEDKLIEQKFQDELLDDPNLASITTMMRKKPDSRRQFTNLFLRSWNSIRKESVVAKIRLFEAIFLAFLVGFVYRHKSDSGFDQSTALNVSGALFWATINLGVTSLYNSITSMCSELPTVMRESGQSDLYQLKAFFIAKQSADLPLFLLTPFLFMTIFYFLIGLQSDIEHYSMAVLIALLHGQSGVGFGILLSCLTADFNAAAQICPLIFLPLINVAGFYQNEWIMPEWIRWLKYLSPWFYANEAFNANQWADFKGHIECDAAKGGICFKSGIDILNYYGFQNRIRFDLIMLIAISVVSRILSYFALKLHLNGRKVKLQSEE